jgi:hypothetical protein
MYIPFCVQCIASIEIGIGFLIVDGTIDDDAERESAGQRNPYSHIDLLRSLRSLLHSPVEEEVQGEQHILHNHPLEEEMGVEHIPDRIDCREDTPPVEDPQEVPHNKTSRAPASDDVGEYGDGCDVDDDAPC